MDKEVLEVDKEEVPAVNKEEDENWEEEEVQEVDTEENFEEEEVDKEKEEN